MKRQRLGNQKSRLRKENKQVEAEIIETLRRLSEVISGAKMAEKLDFI